MASVGARKLALFTRQRRFEKLAERIQCVIPGVALVLYEGMQGSDANRLAVCGAIFQQPSERRAVWEIPLREKRSDLHFRMYTRFQVAINFQDEAVAESDRRIGLFGL